MDIFTQNSNLKRIIYLLILINLILIVYLFFFQNPSSKEKDVFNILKRELQLSNDQVEKFKDLRTQFFEKEKLLRNKIKEQRDSMNLLMFSKNSIEEKILNHAHKVADLEYEMEILRFEQSKELKKICNSEQIEKFERLVKEMKNYFKPQK